MTDVDVVAVQNKVQFLTWPAGWISGLAFPVGIIQAGGFHKQEDFVFTPKSVEVSGNDDRFFCLHDQLVQVAELHLSVTILK